MPVLSTKTYLSIKTVFVHLKLNTSPKKILILFIEDKFQNIGSKLYAHLHMFGHK